MHFGKFVPAHRRKLAGSVTAAGEEDGGRGGESTAAAAAEATSEPISLHIGRCRSANVASVIFKGTIYANCVMCLQYASRGNASPLHQKHSQTGNKCTITCLLPPF